MDAIIALGKIGPGATEAVPALAEKLQDEDATILLNVIVALTKIGPAAEAAISVLIGNLEFRRGTWDAADALSQIGPSAAPALVELIRRSDGLSVREAAASSLSRIGSGAVPVLIEALKDERRDVRYYAVEILGTIGPSANAAVPALVEELRSETRAVRLNVMSALGSIGSEAKAAIPSLREAEHDEDRVIRDYAQRALRSIDPSDAETTCDAIDDQTDRYVSRTDAPMDARNRVNEGHLGSTHGHFGELTDEELSRQKTKKPRESRGSTMRPRGLEPPRD